MKKSPRTPAPLTDIHNARVLAMLGNSITTDHISPAGSIGVDTPAGKWLIAQGVKPVDFNSYGARRGNHEVMMRGTFANIRLRNQLAPGTEGGWTVHQPDGEKMSIYDASMKYQKEGDAADRAGRKGIRLGIVARLGGQGHAAARRARGDRGKLRAHPSQQPAGHGCSAAAISSAGESAQSLGLTGFEEFTIEGISKLAPGMAVEVHARDKNGKETVFQTMARADTPEEVNYYRHGGILPYVLRQML